MSKSVKNGLLVVAVVTLLGYFSYKLFILPDSKKVVISYLDATFGKDPKHTDFINSAKKSYVDSWAKAIMRGEDTFSDGGTLYNTSGGTAKR
jgi:hypothetical protein